MCTVIILPFSVVRNWRNLLELATLFREVTMV